MKKAISLLLTFLIIASVFVMGVGTASAATSITSVKITGVKKPVAGEHPDYSGIKLVTEPADAAEIVDVHWWHNGYYPYLADDATFVAGEEYDISFTVRPKAGYRLDFSGADQHYTGAASIEGFTVDFADESNSYLGSLFLDSKVVYPEHPELTDDQFLMYADDVFSITGRGVVLTGRVLNGRVDKGDNIKVTYYNGTETVTIDVVAEGIEMFHKQLDYAEKGDNIGLLIGTPFGINEDESINKGNMSTSSGIVVQDADNAIPPTTTIVGTFEMATYEDGGRKNPIEEGYRPQVFIVATDCTCTFVDLNGGAIEPGETRENVKLSIVHGVVVYEGQVLTIREGGKTIGTFTVGERTAITSVKITGVNEPVAGEHPDYSGIKLVTEPAGAAEIFNPVWIDSDTNVLEESDTFVAGKTYTFGITVNPKAGYCFEYDVNDYTGEASIDGVDLAYAMQFATDPGKLYLISDVYPVHTKLTDDQFLMYADDVFSITGRGIVLTGRVLNGRVDKGDNIKVTYYNGTETVTIDVVAEGIEMFHKQLDYAEKGDNIGLLIGTPFGTNEDGSINKGNLSTSSGIVVQGADNVISPTTTIVGTFEMATYEEGGRKNPIELGHSPQVFIVTTDCTCTFVGLNGGVIKPGEIRENVKLSIVHGVVVYEGQVLTIREGGKTIGTFTVGERTAITSVKITGVKQPVVGEHPDYSGIKLITEPADTAEIVAALWFDSEYNLIEESDTFVAGKTYKFAITVKPKAGYCFEYDANDYTGEASIDGIDLAYAKQSVTDLGQLFLANDYVTAVEGEKYLCGDVDLDGKVTVKDATLIQKHLAGLVTLSDVQLTVADANGDGKVSVSDATTIQKYVAGIIASLPYVK